MFSNLKYFYETYSSATFYITEVKMYIICGKLFHHFNASTNLKLNTRVDIAYLEYSNTILKRMKLEKSLTLSILTYF